MKTFLFNLLRWLLPPKTVEVRLKPKEKFRGPVKVLGIAGSPRGTKSSSYKMLETVLAHARNFGAETQTIILCEKRMRLCEGCVSDDDRECVFPCIHKDDDTNEILQAMIDADAFVFATPVHWAAPSAGIRILLDKMTAIEANHHLIAFQDGREPLLGKPCALFASQEGDGGTSALNWLAGELRELGVWTLPWGQTFKPRLLNKAIVRAGLNIIGERKFEWINENLRLAAKNLVEISRLLKEKNYQWDDLNFIAPNC